MRKEMNLKIKTIDEYIKLYPQDVQEILDKIRQVIKEAAPDATEAISYGIPTFKLNGNLVHFAAYKNHIGFYPGAAGIEAFKKDFTKYNTSKGTVQFPINETIPFDLIKRITEYRVRENLKKESN